MPYYPEVNLLFIHIPKTGGTIIETCISKQFEQNLYSNFPNHILDPPYNMASLQHQFYQTIYNYKKTLTVDFENVKTFSVVRNPYDRIISDMLWLKLIKLNFTADQVFSVIKYNYLHRNDLDNHNVPQYRFVTDENNQLIPSIKIFKCETLNEKNKELNSYLGFDINIRHPNANKNYSRYLNKKSISLINYVYKLDFELFGYEMW